MKKLVAVFFAAIFTVAFVSVASANCDNGMALPANAVVSSVTDTKTLQSYVMVTGVTVTEFHHYSHQEGDVIIPADDSGKFPINLNEGIGFNFTFVHSACSQNSPYVLLTKEQLAELAEAKLRPNYLGQGVGAACNRPGGTCVFIVVPGKE